MNKYDIHLADVPFRETNESKFRPVLILNDAVFLVNVLPITSKGKTAELQYEIKNWKAAGLDKQSYIYLEPIRLTDRSMIHERIGELQPEDKFNLEMRFMR